MNQLSNDVIGLLCTYIEPNPVEINNFVNLSLRVKQIMSIRYPKKAIIVDSIRQFTNMDNIGGNITPILKTIIVSNTSRGREQFQYVTYSTDNSISINGYARAFLCGVSGCTILLRIYNLYNSTITYIKLNLESAITVIFTESKHNDTKHHTLCEPYKKNMHKVIFSCDNNININMFTNWENFPDTKYINYCRLYYIHAKYEISVWDNIQTYGTVYMVSKGDKIIKLLYDDKSYLQLGDGGTHIYCLNNNNILIENIGDYGSIVVIQFNEKEII
jgi:hypothetical protein